MVHLYTVRSMRFICTRASKFFFSFWSVFCLFVFFCFCFQVFGGTHFSWWSGDVSRKFLVGEKSLIERKVFGGARSFPIGPSLNFQVFDAPHFSWWSVSFSRKFLIVVENLWSSREKVFCGARSFPIDPSLFFSSIWCPGFFPVGRRGVFSRKFMSGGESLVERNLALVERKVFVAPAVFSFFQRKVFIRLLRIFPFFCQFLFQGSLKKRVRSALQQLPNIIGGTSIITYFVGRVHRWELNSWVEKGALVTL